MKKFEEWAINIITLIIFIALIVFVGTLVGFGLYSIWQVIN